MTRGQAIRIIHTAKNRLGWDDTFYRGMLMQATGKKSCTDCSLFELEKMVRVVRDAGFHRPCVVNTPQMKKAYALWKELHRLGAVNTGTWQAMKSWIDRQGGTLNDAIEGLKKWQKRVNPGGEQCQKPLKA